MLIDLLIPLIINIWPPIKLGTLLLYIGKRITVDLKFNLCKSLIYIKISEFLGFFSLFVGGYYVQTTQNQ